MKIFLMLHAIIFVLSQNMTARSPPVMLQHKAHSFQGPRNEMHKL